MTTKLLLYTLTAGLNGGDGLIRSEQRRSRKKLDELQYLIRNCKPKPLPHPGCVVIRYIRFCHSLMDWDNAYASWKYLGDALKGEGIITDDSPRIVKRLYTHQVVISRKLPVYTIIIIDDVNGEEFDRMESEKIANILKTM